MTFTFRLSICLIIIAGLTGCVAGGGHPRRDAFSTLRPTYGIDLATRVARDQVLGDGDLSVLKKIATDGDQNVLFCLLSNRNVPTLFQQDLIVRASGWGLQGIGYNKKLYTDPEVKQAVSQKTDGVSKSIYALLWTDNTLGFPQETNDYRNELESKETP